MYLRIATVLVAALLITAANAQTASKSTYLKLMDVQKLWEEENYTQALAELRQHATKTGDDPYDHAVVHQYIAHTAILAGQTQTARGALEVALAMPGLPQKLLSELKLFYGQLVLGDEDYELARRMLEDWYQTAEGKKQPAPIFSLAYANYQTGNLARAEPLLAEAIGSVPQAKDSWYRLYYQVLFERKKYRDAELVLYGLLNRDSDNESYWRLLANHYLQIEDSREALAAMAIAHQQDLLTDPDDLKRLVSLYSFVEIPEKAARLLEQYLADGTIPEKPETLKQLGDLWLVARERAEAKKYLQRAAAVAPDGRTYELLGSIYFEDENWREAHNNFLRALNLGGIEDAPRIYLLAGVSAFRAGMRDEARSALNEARKSNKLRPQADSVLKRLNDS